MSELAPEGGAKLMPGSAGAETDAYVQKTSLAADKPVLTVLLHILNFLLCCLFSFEYSLQLFLPQQCCWLTMTASTAVNTVIVTGGMLP